MTRPCLSILLLYWGSLRTEGNDTAYAFGACGHTALSATSGNVSSPGYPSVHSVLSLTDPLYLWFETRSACTLQTNTMGQCYDCYSQCSWTLEASVGHAIRLTVDDMLFDDLQCCRNYLEIRDGPEETSPLIALPCGTQWPQPLQSSGSSLFVRLMSAHDQGRSDHKFTASWITVKQERRWTCNVYNVFRFILEVQWCVPGDNQQPQRRSSGCDSWMVPNLGTGWAIAVMVFILVVAFIGSRKKRVKRLRQSS